VVLGPGIVNPGEEFPVNVFAEDYVGNPAVAELGELHVIRQLHSHSVSFPPIRQQRVSPEVLALTFRAPEEEGPLALTITAVALGLSADLENTRVSRNPTRIFWGDIHIHTDLSDGVGSLDDNIHFARTIAALDICAITDHDFLLTDDEWKLTQDAAETASVENVFLVFAGYEFSAETSEGGDRNVLYRERGPIIRCAKSEGPTVPSAWELYEKLPESDVLIIPHVGGRRANWDYYDHRERLAEITSVHGVFDPFFQEAITRGYKVGAVGSGDGHIGHPGRTFPGLTWARKRNGLVGVLAPALTRQDIWSALFERRVYATTGARILLNLSISRQPIGSVIERQARVSISGWVQGTAVISDIVLWSDCQQIMVFHPDQQAVELEWQVDLPQSAHAIYLEVRQGDGEKAWSSPVWMESAPEQTGAMSER